MADVDRELETYILNSYRRFNQMTAERMQAGVLEYGSLGFLNNDVIQMAKEEVADLANYARMLFVKLELMEQALTSGGFFYASGHDSTGSSDGDTTSGSTD